MATTFPPPMCQELGPVGAVPPCDVPPVSLGGLGVHRVAEAMVAEGVWWPGWPRKCGGRGGRGGVVAAVAAVPAGCRLHSSAGGSCATPPVPLNINAALHCAAAPATGEPPRPSRGWAAAPAPPPGLAPPGLCQKVGGTHQTQLCPLPRARQEGQNNDGGTGSTESPRGRGSRGVGSPPSAPRDPGMPPRADLGQNLLAKAAASGSASATTVANRG